MTQTEFDIAIRAIHAVNRAGYPRVAYRMLVATWRSVQLDKARRKYLSIHAKLEKAYDAMEIAYVEEFKEFIDA